ncbi:hypothetical protein HK097_000123 [Rhizophlyctis rosea]|uniref:Pre-rRNA-processing protein TSR2 homolog n=1 Tax=Rhizophlyctis rosea TaxID=64517 RepID=A0AAD5S8L1_9FUNG|nr:hypothetical protein HK097_000123 [Rhizophlyctis rosea]
MTVAPPNHPNWDTFSAAITLTFIRWTALQICLDNQLAGRETAESLTTLHTHTLKFFRDFGTEVQAYELADNFTSYFDEVFDVDIEDGSPRQVGDALVKLYREVMIDGNTAGVEELKVKVEMSGNAGARASVRQGGEDDEDDSEDEDENDGEVDSPMEVDAGHSAPAPRPEPVIDEDGFELVQKKGRRRN